MEGLQSKFKKAISKFKISEFPSMLSFVFGDEILSMDRVRREVDDLRLKKLPKYLAEVCCVLYQKTRPSKEDVIIKICLLQLCDVALHSNREWYGMKLTDPFPDSPPSSKRIDKYITRAYQKELRDVIVHKMEKGKLIYIMAIENKSTKKGNKHLAPVFFVCNTGLKAPYVFYTPKQSNPYPLELFTAALGYEDYTFLPIGGKEVTSLFQMVERKVSGTVALRPPPVFTIPAPVGEDYTTYWWKKEYAEQVLPDPTPLKTLMIKASTDWRGTSVAPRLKGMNKVKCSITIQSNKRGVSVDNLLREFITRGIISSPVPEWLLSFAKKPRTTITIRSLGNSSSSNPSNETSRNLDEGDQTMPDA